MSSSIEEYKVLRCKWSLAHCIPARTLSGTVLKKIQRKKLINSDIGVGEGKVLGVRRIFAGISQTCPKNLCCAFCPQIFSHKDHEDVFCVTSKKTSYCVFMKTLGAISWGQTTLGAIFARIFRNFARFSGILPRFSDVLPKFSDILYRFSTNQNFLGCACTPASYTTEFRHKRNEQMSPICNKLLHF